MDYKAAGVDIEAGEELVERIKPFVKKTRTSGVLSEIGLFGGFFDARFEGYNHPVLVASTDGVGTKLKVAIEAGVHNTVGQCLVNHCVNDILACGAKPQFFLDYFATGVLSTDVAVDVIRGLAIACEENACALLGGETAEMPSMYADGEYDVAGTIVGVVEKSKIISGSTIENGNVLIGFQSNGLHTNGFSLARKALFPKYDVHQHLNELGCTVAEALLAVHKSYLNVITRLLDADLVRGLSHITGGGIIGNTKRIMPKGLALELDWGTWYEPPIFDVIRKAGGIAEEEMRNVFNLGVGMIAIVDAASVAQVLSITADHKSFVAGRVVTAA
jgi:phosphoribosylformylglycinamidine cyclo-ligase